MNIYESIIFLVDEQRESCKHSNKLAQFCIFFYIVRYDLLQYFWMPNKILIVIFSFICFYLVSVNSGPANKEEKNTKCFAYSLDDIPIKDQFKYTVITAWDKQWKLNASQHIYVEGWNIYEDHKASSFFKEIGEQTSGILNELRSTSKEITYDIHKKDYGQDTTDMQFAFGEVSKARQYTVPKGKVLLGLRFQVKNSYKLGHWSVLLKLINNLDFQAQKTLSDIQKKIDNYYLNPLVIARSLNIIPSFVAGSIFSVLKNTTGISRGTTKPVEYEGYVLAIPQNQQFLAGAIEDGHKGIIQILDKVKQRKICKLQFRRNKYIQDEES